jgi:hypothetical protein
VTSMIDSNDLFRSHLEGIMIVPSHENSCLIDRFDVWLVLKFFNSPFGQCDGPNESDSGAGTLGYPNFF